MTNTFKSHAKSSTLLYKLWFYIIRYRNGDYVRLPSVKDDLYFDGYPKSGNTYFSGLISTIYPLLNFASHLHTVAGLKIAARKSVPIFIIIRDPKDAIVSNLARKSITKTKYVDQKYIDNMVLEYNNYYDYVVNNMPMLQILNFSSAIRDEQSIINEIATQLGLEKYSKEEFIKLRDKFNLNMREIEKNKTDMASALPNKKREAFKNEHRDSIQNSKHFKRSIYLYKKLTTLK